MGWTKLFNIFYKGSSVEMKWIKVNENHLEKILRWRTSEFVTRYMYTDIQFDLQKQMDWFKKISQDKNGFYWVIEEKNQLIGFVSITNIDWYNKRGEWNYYIGEQKYGMLGGFIGVYMYNYAFNQLGLEKMQGAVLENNIAVRKIHQKLGDREVGYYEKHIFKNSHWYNVYLYEMTKEMWQENGLKFRKYQAEVER